MFKLLPGFKEAVIQHLMEGFCPEYNANDQYPGKAQTSYNLRYIYNYIDIYTAGRLIFFLGTAVFK